MTFKIHQRGFGETSLGHSHAESSFDREYSNPEFLNKLAFFQNRLLEKGASDEDDKDGSKPGFIYNTPAEILKVGDKNYNRYMCRVGLINGVILEIGNTLKLERLPLSLDDESTLKLYAQELEKITNFDSEGKNRKNGGHLKLTFEEVQRVKQIIQLVAKIMEVAYQDTAKEHSKLMKPKSFSATA